jgi:hypothetical protein
MVCITRDGSRLALHAPYHPSFPYRAGQLGGRWDASTRMWVFPADCDASLRALCLEIWGVDGSPVLAGDLTALCITVDERRYPRTTFEALEMGVYLGGREIACALPRRRAARPGQGVVFLRGWPLCGGSEVHWVTVIPNGSQFLVRDLPTSVAERVIAQVGANGEVEVVENTSPSASSGKRKRRPRSARTA